MNRCTYGMVGMLIAVVIMWQESSMIALFAGAQEMLLLSQPLDQISNVNEQFQELIKKSSQFEHHVSFPTTENRIAVIAGNDLKKQQRIVAHARGTYPIMHQSVHRLINDFLVYKKKQGSVQEENLYRNMTHQDFIIRLLTKRPLMFMNASDDYLLRDGKTRGSAYDAFELIGTAHERAPFVLKEYLSYDEMQIAALLGVSVPTYFINEGDRTNRAVPGKKGSFEEEGVYVGLVGARFEKPEFMEWKYMVVTPSQNTIQRGYGLQNKQAPEKLRIWEAFYNTKFPTFDEVQHDGSGRYLKISSDKYLDTLIYQRRMRSVVEPFLLDANERGKQAGKKVYLHAVGLGTGVWAIHASQNKVLVEVFAQVMRDHTLSYVGDIDFSWFGDVADCGGVQHGKKFMHHSNDITILFSKRNPAAKLTGAHAGKLLVACYAWDGNAYPGNEYWNGALSASGDPAAICCSTLGELQNPEINQYLLDNIVRINPSA
jgi:hypothetical protein